MLYGSPAHHQEPDDRQFEVCLKVHEARLQLKSGALNSEQQFPRVGITQLQTASFLCHPLSSLFDKSWQSVGILLPANSNPWGPKQLRSEALAAIARHRFGTMGSHRGELIGQIRGPGWWHNENHGRGDTLPACVRVRLVLC